MTNIPSEALCTALGVLQILERDALAANKLAVQLVWTGCREVINEVSNRLRKAVVDEITTRGIQ